MLAPFRILLTVLAVTVVQSKITTGSIQARNTQWMFLDKFCFDSSGGNLTIEWTESAETPSKQQILLYHDLDHGFPSIYDTGNSCQFKSKLAANTNVTLYTSRKVKSQEFVVSGVRPRWWYVVLANCETSSELLDLKSYTITYTNAGGKFRKHFSNDDEGIFEVLILSVIALLLLLAAFAFSFCKAVKDNAQVKTVHTLMLITIGAELIAVIMHLAHFSAYSEDGVGHPVLEDLVLFVSLFPDTLLTALLVLVSKGWMVSSGRIEKNSFRGLVEMLLVYFATSIALFFWSFRATDPALLLSIWQTPPGVILCILRAVLLIWFMSNLAQTYRNERVSVKKSFYVQILVFGALHFASVPIIVIVAEAMNTWNRKKSVIIVDLLINLAVYTTMWVLFSCSTKHLKHDDGDRVSHEGLAHNTYRESVDDRDIEMESNQQINFAPVKVTGRTSSDDEDEASSDEETS